MTTAAQLRATAEQRSAVDLALSLLRAHLAPVMALEGARRVVIDVEAWVAELQAIERVLLAALAAAPAPRRQIVRDALALCFSDQPYDRVEWVRVSQAFDEAWPETAAPAPPSETPAREHGNNLRQGVTGDRPANRAPIADEANRVHPGALGGVDAGERPAPDSTFVAAPPSASGWQPIKTAAKDIDVPVLLWVPGYGVTIGTWLSMMKEWCYSDNVEDPPTHWMPLPAPPRPGTRGGQPSAAPGQNEKR